MPYIIPTDTCYGLAGTFTERDYLEIYRLKGRSFAKPLALLVESFEDMKKYIEITDEQIEFLISYHRPWSCLAPRNPSFVLPDWMDEYQYARLSLRVASVCLKSPPLSGGQEQSIYPLYLTSANLSGYPESKTLTEARVCFPWIDGIDGGICDFPPSDIIYWEGREVKWMRKVN
jgi:tRNA A37 threonylcarbamoyladenosine synthetase subunit TsaC/SUA5/YrdC